MSCTFNTEKCDSPPKADPVVLAQHKGANARYYQFHTNKAVYDRRQAKYAHLARCDREGCAPHLSQALSDQQLFDANGVPVNGNVAVEARLSLPNQIDATYSDRKLIRFMESEQVMARQCNLYGNMCGRMGRTAEKKAVTAKDAMPAYCGKYAKCHVSKK